MRRIDRADVLSALGVASFVIGVAMIHRPSGAIALGLILFALGYLDATKK